MRAITIVFSDIVKPYIDTVKQALTDQVNNDGCKNHFGTSLSNAVYNGIIYQNDGNNIITANGTVTQSPSAAGGTSTYITGLIVGETYVLSGLPESTTISGGEAFIKIYKNDRSYSEIKTSSGNKTLTFTYDGTNAMAIDVGIRTVGAVVTNAVFKPMICLKSLYDADPTFAPYAKSNKELTEIVDPLKTQFDADHIIVKTISDAMNIYWTDNATPSDWSNLTTQQATDIAQALYDVFKKIGGAAGKRNTGIIRKNYKKASDGSEIASSVLMADLYSNSSYNSMLSNNASARFTLTMCPYGETSRITFSLWGNKLMLSKHGIDNSGTVFDFDKLYTYNTISTYKG